MNQSTLKGNPTIEVGYLGIETPAYWQGVGSSGADLYTWGAGDTVREAYLCAEEQLEGLTPNEETTLEQARADFLFEYKDVQAIDPADEDGDWDSDYTPVHFVVIRIWR